jgi:hypothetical protein
VVGFCDGFVRRRRCRLQWCYHIWATDGRRCWQRK